MMSQHGSRPKYRSSLQQEGTMDLFIETLTGTAFEMTVSPFDTIMSIKSKIQRVEGIPVSQQHLLYNLQELEDSSCLIDYSIKDGATLKLVLSMRGGPISTRRLPPTDDTTWKELRDFVESNREDVFEHLPPGCRVTVLVFKDGDHVNLFRVIENGDGTYSPLSESWSGSSIRNLFAEDDPEENAKKFHENSVTMGKMRDLRSKMEALSLQRKQPKKSAPRVLSAKKSLLHARKGTPRPCNKVSSQEQREDVKGRPSQNFLQLPPLVSPPPPQPPPLPPPLATVASTSSSSAAAAGISSANPPMRFRLAPLSTSLSSKSAVETNQADCCEDKSLNNKQNFQLLNNSNKVHHTVKKEPKELDKLNNLSPSAPNTVKHVINKRSSYSVHNGNISSRDNIQKNSEWNRRSLPALEKHKSEMKRSGKQSVNHVMVNRGKNTNVLGTSNIAIVEEEGDSSAVNVDPDFSPPSNAIPVPSKEATTFTLSQVPRERVTSVGSGRYRVSRLVLDDECRPKTSPDKLSQHEKSTLEMWGILTDTKWHRHRRRSSHCNSSIDLLGFPATKTKDNETPSAHNRASDEKPLSFRSSLSDLPARSPKFGRRSLNSSLDATKEHKRSEWYQPVATERSVHKPQLHPSPKMNSEGNSLQMLPVLETKLPHLSIPEATLPKKSIRIRCAECKKRLNITNTYTCRCEKTFCSAHRYSELHNCTYDYKSEGRKLLEQSNPLVTAPKLPKI